MKVKQLEKPFVAVQFEEGEKWSIAIGNHVLSDRGYDEDECEQAVKAISNPLLINFIGFMVNYVVEEITKKSPIKDEEVKND